MLEKLLIMKEIEEHINLIEEENKISEKSSRLLELQNWLNYISAN